MTDEPPYTEWCDVCRDFFLSPHEHRLSSTGLDDGPWLPGQAPRKKPPPKTPEEVREIKMKAVATRRARYGPKGHR